MTNSVIINPILPGFNPDPSIVRVGEDFYIATSTFEWYPGVQIHHSRDLKHWRLLTRPLNRKSLLDMRGEPDSCGVWAPCLTYDHGLFYLIYTDVKRFDGDYKDSHNYLTSCTTIDGQWSDPVYLNSSGFDPSLFHDDDGKKWLVNMIWDHRHNQHRFAGIALQEYCATQKTLVGQRKNIFQGSTLGITEAPHLYKRNGYYYLVTAQGGTGYNHAITLARSKQLDGPYEIDPQGYLLTAKDNQHLPLQRSGHGDLVETTTGEHYLVHLCSRPLTGERRSPMGRETGLQKTIWTDDGWLRLEGANGDGLPALHVPAPNLPQHPWPKVETCHEFDSEELPMEFQWLRTPFPEKFMSLSERPGYLRLTGKESIGSLYEHALIARRQQAFVFSATTKIDFMPSNFQQSAGLVCYYNSHKFHYLYISIDDGGQRFIDVMSCLGDPQQHLSFELRESHTADLFTDPRFILPAQGEVFLRAKVDHHMLQFEWSLQGDIWQSIPNRFDYSVMCDETGKGEGASFTGAFIGMACHDTSGQNCTADFDFFEYIQS